MIASHDTMTYLRPRQWWMRPFHFIARCQRLPIEKQLHNHGVRMFDIRLRWNKRSSKWLFAHGCMTFAPDTPEEIFRYLNTQAQILRQPIYIRLLLEYNRPPRNADDISNRFAAYAAELCAGYTHLSIFGFNRKYDWKQLYSYPGMPTPSIYQATSSATWRILDDWFPALYAKTHNHDNIIQGTSSDWLMLDFIGYYK